MNPDSLVWAAAAGLFASGAAFLVLRRQLVAMVIGVELMVNGANLLIVYHAARRGDPAGYAAALLILAAAAAEVVVGLSLILALRQSGETAETGDIRSLAG